MFWKYKSFEINLRYTFAVVKASRLCWVHFFSYALFNVTQFGDPFKFGGYLMCLQRAKVCMYVRMYAIVQT